MFYQEKKIEPVTAFDPQKRIDGEVVQDMPGFFLARLKRFIGLREQFEGSAQNTTKSSTQEGREKLLRRAIYSTYCDCIEQEVGDEARALFNPKV